MIEAPFVVFLALLLGQMAAEYSAMLWTGALRRKHRREWTCYAVALPFKAMICAAIVEHVVLHTQPAMIAIVAGSVLAGAGIVIRAVGHFELGSGFSPYVEKGEGQKLVESGMYARIRHPMYTGSILIFLGMPLVLAVWSAWLFSALGLAGILIRMRKEEAFLSKELPGYREYLKKTWRLVPYIY